MRRLSDLMTGLPGDFGHRRCDACDLFFLSPRPREDQIAFYYPHSYLPHAPAAGIAQWRRVRVVGTAARRARLVARFVAGGRILDVGCGNGLFLQALGAEDWQRYAMDVEQYGRFPESVPFFAGRFDSQAPPVESLDVVTLWHVFEHLYHPERALRHAHGILRPGGHLFLAVPDLRCLERRLFGGAWIGWDAPRHVAVYGRRSVEAMLSRAGFRLTALLPDAVNGATVALNLEFALRRRGIGTRLGSSLLLQALLTPWAELTRHLGLASAKVYVATR